MPDEIDDMIDDRFETVAVTWSQPEAAVMLSMFAFYGIPALSVGQQAVRTLSYYAVALQGIQIRVHHDWLDDALDLLGEVAERPAAVRPYAAGQPWAYRVFVIGAAMLFAVELWFTTSTDSLVLPDDGTFALMALISLPMTLLLTGPPPTRTPSTLMLWKRSRPA